MRLPDTGDPTAGDPAAGDPANRDADVAIAAAQAGAAVVRARYGSALTRFDKGAMDFATDADIAAERAILEVLRAARPADAYRGEELGASGDETSGRVWYIDPLCGTLNFAAQTPLMSVNVALRTTGGTPAAASADPIAAETFWTDGRAAHRRREGVDSTLSPSPTSRLVDVDLDLPAAGAGPSQALRMLADPAFQAAFQPRMVATSLALAWVAAGRRAAYVAEGDPRDSVHYASGIALCQAAGCVVTGLSGQPLDSAARGLLVAADEETHASLIAILSRRSPG